MMQETGARGRAEGALGRCRSLNPVPSITERRLLGILGGVHTANHRWQAAIKAFEQSIAVGDVVQDLRRLSFLYSGMSMAYQDLNNIPQAAHYAHRAVTLHETLPHTIPPPRPPNHLLLILPPHGHAPTS